MRNNITKLLVAFILFAGFALSLHPLYGAAGIGTTGSLGALQHTEVVGAVRDSTGSILTGVSVAVKNKSNIGTTTDLNGRYVLADVPKGSILVFSMVGFEAQEIALNDAPRQEINVVLIESRATLDDVVVTAFGGQVKRTDMVGSITTVRPSDLQVPSSNLTTALAGRVAGMIAFQRSGEPGMDNADFFIRGVTTFGYKVDPLILIDNIEVTTTELARLQPDDIASFSILKDATATAVYGARGANGVILVTTKQGAEGKVKVAARLEHSISAPTQTVELADPVTYMRMHNEAIKTRDPLGQVLYSEDKIDGTREGRDPLMYPANDWRKLLFNDYTTTQRLNLNLSGGGSIARYFVSGSYNKDNGLLKVDPRNNFNNNIKLNSYTLRSNVNINLTKTTELVTRLSGNFDDYNGPIYSGTDMYNRVMHSNPVLFPAYYPNTGQYAYVSHIMYGNYREGVSDAINYINPYADMTKGYKDYSRSLMMAQLELKQDFSFLLEGLTFNALANTYRRSYFDVFRAYQPYFYQVSGYDRITGNYSLETLNEDTATEYLDFNPGNRQISSSFYLQSMLNYNRTFHDVHGISGMLVYQLNNRIESVADDLQNSLPFRNVGLSGKLTYSYDNRYFTEFDFGYNGSERFHKNYRFGFFPSFGLAWTISNERFMEPMKDVVSNFRIRATYGLIGNDAIGSPADRFFYLSNVNMNNGEKGATFGNGTGSDLSLPGVSVSRYANPDITWERARKQNIALELGLFNNLNVIAEYFWEYRDRILMDRAFVPTTMGLTAPIRANVGAASGRGTDISLDYKKFFNSGFWLQSMGNFTYATSRYEKYEEPLYAEQYRYRVGTPIYQKFGFIAERLFVDDAEAENSPRQNFGEYGGGDIKYLDVNGDGEITGADEVPIGNPTVPEIVYGIGFSMGNKNIDFSMFFQGLANESFWIDAVATAPFKEETQVLKAYADSYWSEDHRDVFARWPRLSATVNENNTKQSTWFMQDGAFIRLKQVELGYKLPSQWLQRINVSNFRIYLNATNLFTISKFKLWDVEMSGNGLGYPIQRVFNIGINMDL